MEHVRTYTSKLMKTLKNQKDLNETSTRKQPASKSAKYPNFDPLWNFVNNFSKRRMQSYPR
jgi:hypothetical protein